MSIKKRENCLCTLLWLASNLLNICSHSLSQLKIAGFTEPSRTKFKWRREWKDCSGKLLEKNRHAIKNINQLFFSEKKKTNREQHLAVSLFWALGSCLLFFHLDLAIIYFLYNFFPHLVLAFKYLICASLLALVFRHFFSLESLSLVLVLCNQSSSISLLRKS